MDANFKLKQKERGFKDPPLSNGLMFMVANDKLQEHLAQCSKTKELTSNVRVSAIFFPFPCLHLLDFADQINTCGSSFNAVSHAYTKDARGYAVTGVGGVDCARHGFKRPNGVVDLQKGER